MSVVRNRTPEKVEHAQGGNGYILRDTLLSEEQLRGICTFASCITLDPGCEIGPHIHANNTEMYFLISGKAVYNDNGTEEIVRAGDVMFCNKGQTHAIKNVSDSPISFVALIQE